MVKIGSIHSLNMNWNTLFLNSYIYWNGMFFLTIIHIHFIETTQNYSIFWYMYYYQLVTFLTILKITAFLMIFWNVFIHSHAEWSVKCRERQTKYLKYNDNYNYPEDPVFQYPHLIETTTCIDFVPMMTFLVYIEYQNFTIIQIEEIILQVLILFEESNCL
jgi:hypothetical protein